jgi:hypothetical protein
VQAGKDCGGAGKIKASLPQGLGALGFSPAEFDIIYVPPKIKIDLLGARANWLLAAEQRGAGF